MPTRVDWTRWVIGALVFTVHGDATPLQAGMCFSDEPGLYLPGEFGIRLEDCWVMTEAGPKLFTPLAASLDAPI